MSITSNVQKLEVGNKALLFAVDGSALGGKVSNINHSLPELRAWKLIVMVELSHHC